MVAANDALHAQSVRFDLDAGVAHARPPADVEADAATYAMLGGRFTVGPLFGSLYGGLGADASAADWLGAVLGASLQGPPAPLRLGVTTLLTAFTLGDPTPYDAATLRLIPEFRVTPGGVPLALRLHGGLGQSDVTDTRVTPAASVISDLWMYGAGLEISQPLGSVQGWLGADGFETATGFYLTSYVGAGGLWGRNVWRVHLQIWDTPGDVEVQLGISLTVPIGPRWSLELTGARSGPDPLLGSPAGLDGSVLVSWNAAASAVGGSPLVTLMADGSTVAVFRLAQEDARSVSVIGDFSDWQPIPMVKQGKTWVARVPVQPGLYHFGFLVDGDWHIPEGAPGKITDEFGRWNATLVVPGE